MYHCRQFIRLVAKDSNLPAVSNLIPEIPEEKLHSQYKNKLIFLGFMKGSELLDDVDKLK